MKLLPIMNCTECKYVFEEWTGDVMDYELFCSHPDITSFRLPQPLGDEFPVICPLEDYQPKE